MVITSERLQRWMDEQGHTTTSLAQAVGMSYDGVYQVVHARGRISPGFQIKFIQAFGLDEAHRLFVPESVCEPEPADVAA